jgi:hypothetical protein
LEDWFLYINWKFQQSFQSLNGREEFFQFLNGILRM